MAHHIRVIPIPHKNKDGTESQSKKDYLILDRTRGKKIEVGVVTSRARVDEEIEKWRQFCYRSHAANHPNDHHFIRKHSGK
jgi:hypothetical protein